MENFDKVLCDVLESYESTVLENFITKRMDHERNMYREEFIQHVKYKSGKYKDVSDLENLYLVTDPAERERIIAKYRPEFDRWIEKEGNRTMAVIQGDLADIFDFFGLKTLADFFNVLFIANGAKASIMDIQDIRSRRKAHKEHKKAKKNK